MESRKQRQIPLGCRFIPHDQWFLTHIEPGWKIKHIKQMILAKAFGLPFDPRKFAHETSGARSHSPITFAPDDTARPISPIQFATVQEVRKKKSVGAPEDGDNGSSTSDSSFVSAGKGEEDEGDMIPGDEGYEEDDEYDEEDEAPSPRIPFARPLMGGRVDVGGKVDMAIPTPTSTSTSIASPVGKKSSRKFISLSKLTGSNNAGSSSNQTSSHTSSNNTNSVLSQGGGPSDFVLVQPQDPKKEAEIQTRDYTLIRFSTGQILDEDSVASWYDILPNELVELHASSTPLSFEIAKEIPQLLLDPSYHSTSTSQPGSDSTFASSGITFTALPRHDPVAYVEPYWEGWARALRTVYTSELPISMLGGGKSHTSFQEYGAGMMNYQSSMAGGLALFMMEPGLFPDKYAQGNEANATTKSMEWRERWVVIRDGVLHLCKSRHDLTPTHSMPLATMVALKDVTHLINHANSKPKTYAGTRHRSRTLRSGESERDHRSHHRRSISQPRSTTSTLKDHRHRDRDDGRYTKSQTGSSSRGGLTVDSSRAGEKSSSSSKHHHHHHHHHHSGYHTATGPVGESRGPRRLEDELERQIQRAREKEAARQRQRELRAKEEQELEYLRNWDNVSVTFKRKPKDKDKDKDSADKGKGREDPRHGGGDSKGKAYDNHHKSKRSEAEWGSQWSEKDQTRSSRGYGEDERDAYRSKDRQRRERERTVPRSREEADAAGLKIICCQFKSPRALGRERERQHRSSGASHGLRYTSTGPSLAGEGTTTKDVDAAEKDRERRDANNTTKTMTGDDFSNHQHTQSQSSASQLLQNVAPRKASLPIIQLSSSKPSSNSLALNSPAIGSNAVSLAGGGGSSKFGIGGLFGKDRDRELPSDDPNNAKREKEERKREEKERKAREKEQKMLEKKAKEKEKTKRKEETADEEELTQGSGLAWKLGKKRSGKVKDDALVDSGLFSDSAIPSPSTPRQDSRGRVLQREQHTHLSIETTTQDTAKPPISIVVGGDDEQKQTFPAIVHGEEAITTSAVKPKLTLSSIPNSATKPRSGSNSSSCSLSSPVFHHSSDSDRSINDLDGNVMANTRRAERKGYRYGGYHDRKQEAERKQKAEAGHGPRPSIIGLFDTPEPPKPEPPKPELPSKPSGKGKEKESQNTENLSRPPSRKQPAVPGVRDRAEAKERKEEHGEWIILDMGTDFAFNSILRVFHRSFTEPLSSDFVRGALTAPTSQNEASGRDSASFDPQFNPNSPIQSQFSSSTTLVKSVDHGSHLGEQSRFGPSYQASSSTLAAEYGSASAQEHLHADRYSVASTGFSQETSHHPPSLQSTSKALKTAPLVPSLPYPEWRRELVLRARRYGMRDHCRPLDLALHGWSREFEDIDFAEMTSRLQNREDKETTDFFGSDLYGHNNPAYLDDLGADADDDWVDGESQMDRQSDEQREEVPVTRLRGDEGRRMSQISHVSTLKAAEINAATAASASLKSSSQSIIESFEENDEGDPRPDVEGLWEDSESVVGYKDDQYEPGSGDGRENDEGSDGSDMGSMLSDSDNEEESETEWIAWVTDLPRQIEARRIEKELQKRRREEEEEQKRLEALRKQGYGPGEKPLSPMIFSNPFVDQQQVPPLDVDYLDLEPAHVGPQTQEQERRQYFAERRRLEPTTTMTTTISLGPLANPQERASQKSVMSPTSLLATGIRQPQPQHTRLKNTSTTLSSQSSSESLGHLTRPSEHLSPFPLPISASDIADDRDHDTGSSSTTPASPSFSSAQYSFPSHHLAHSRSISGSDTGHPRLHHSLSMPLGPGSGPSYPRGQGSSVPSSVPHSPITPFTPNKTVLKKPIQPTAMAILSPTQINEIETETNQRIQSQYSTSGFYPAPMSSPSSSFVPKSVPIQMPRRSSSAGNSGSPPPSAVGTMNLSTSLGSAGEIGGSASLGRSSTGLMRSHHPAGGIANERGERERGVLKKRPSDLGKGKERETESSPSLMKQRPKLSLATMSGPSSSPSSSILSSSSNLYTTNQPEIQSPTTSSGKMSSAKAFLRRVRSGSSLRLDSHLEEEDDDDRLHSPRSPTFPTQEGRDMSPPATRRKISTMDRFVRGLDSALEFVEGR